MTWGRDFPSSRSRTPPWPLYAFPRIKSQQPGSWAPDSSSHGGIAVPIAISEHVLPGPGAERFARAKELQADGVELRFGPYDVEQHPLWQAEGPTMLRAQAQAAGVVLPSVYAGYFHQFPLHAADPASRRRHAQVLERLLDACAEAGVVILV